MKFDDDFSLRLYLHEPSDPIKCSRTRHRPARHTADDISTAHYTHQRTPLFRGPFCLPCLMDFDTTSSILSPHFAARILVIPVI